nr:DUF1801 domain-containing protein [uncultured Roseateles sp.]
MPILDPRVDAYIDRAAPFAQPLLRHWRATVHTHCPEVVETIKWGFPNFTYRDKILTGMAAFKAHCSIGFWHGEAAVGADHAKDGAMGDFGKLSSLKDLPPKAEQKARRTRASVAWRRPSAGWPKASGGTGSTRTAEGRKARSGAQAGLCALSSQLLSCTCTLLRPPSLAR